MLISGYVLSFKKLKASQLFTNLEAWGLIQNSILKNTFMNLSGYTCII